MNTETVKRETTLENRRLIEKSKTKKKKIGYNKANVL